MTVVSATLPAVAPRRRGRAGYVFVAPAAILFTATVLVPIGYSMYLSTRGLRITGARTIGGTNALHRREVSVGLQNYSSTLHDPEFGRSLLTMLTLGFIVVPVMLSLATVFALILDAPRTRLRGFSRLAIFLPYAVPGVISSLLWGFLYLPGVSPFRHAAAAIGLPEPNFFSPSSITFSIANIAIWGGVGFNMVVLYTSVRAIPKELFDAARIDGCSELRLAWHIKLPLLRPALVMTSIFSLIAALQVFTEPWSLRSLTNVLPTTWVPLTKIYTDAFVKNDIYSAAASSVVLAVGTLVVSLVILRTAQSRTFGEKK